LKGIKRRKPGPTTNPQNTPKKKNPKQSPPQTTPTNQNKHKKPNRQIPAILLSGEG